MIERCTSKEIRIPGSLFGRIQRETPVFFHYYSHLLVSSIIDESHKQPKSAASTPHRNPNKFDAIYLSGLGPSPSSTGIAAALELRLGGDARCQPLPLHSETVLHRLLLPILSHSCLSLTVRYGTNVERLLAVDGTDDLL
mmetsp:Transcript_21326/g.51558  ORF Transcript_21326/g.51558 Transcript_21326/m.51558 type:complete len:140 (-) Transcript_21326:408-827(-)